MGAIKEAALTRTERGNDPADHRDQETYLDTLDTIPLEDEWSAFEMSDDELNKMKDKNWIYPNLILEGHIIVIPAPPNAGKTTVMMWVAGAIADSCEVIYVNADVGSSDVREMVLFAKEKGFRMLTPDMKLGKSMADVITLLRHFNDTSTDLSGKVFILDTLKKAVDVINKSQAKNIMSLFRGLTAKGATVVLLAHTNKHKGIDGKHIFEGTGDIKSDVDEMIYFESQKNPDGSLVVSTLPDKVRHKFEPITFEISADRQVTTSGYIDVKSMNEEQAQRKKDQAVIDEIRESIIKDENNQQKIVEYCKCSGLGAKNVREVLRRYDPHLWKCKKGDKNAWIYSL